MMTPNDREINVRCSKEQKRDGWERWLYVAEVLNREVVVESWKSEDVRLTTLVRSPDVVALISWCILCP